MEATPKYRHDCKECIFLGGAHGGNTYYDAYIHDDSIILRRGNDGPDYWSTDVRMLPTVTGESTYFDGTYAGFNIEGIVAQFFVNKFHYDEPAEGVYTMDLPRLIGSMPETPPASSKITALWQAFPFLSLPTIRELSRGTKTLTRILGTDHYSLEEVKEEGK